MEHEEIPQVVKDKILYVLHSNERWIYYESRLKEYKKKKNVEGVNRMQGILSKLESEVLNNYLKEKAEENTTVGELLQIMPESDRTTVMESLHTIVFMCDMIDSCILDVQSTIKQTFPDGEITSYESLNLLSEEVKMQIGAILGTASDKNKELFCKYSDKAQEYIRKQVRYFLKTQQLAKEKEEWNAQHRDKLARKVHQ